MTEADRAAPAPESYYVAHKRIHAREVTGTFSRLRKAAVILLLGIYYVLPWFQWDDRQAVLFDLPARKFKTLPCIRHSKIKHS